MTDNSRYDVRASSDAQKKRAAIKLANRIKIDDVSQIVITGGGVGLLCTKTLREAISSRSGGLTAVIADL